MEGAVPVGAVPEQESIARARHDLGRLAVVLPWPNWFGAVAALGTAAAVLATGGMYLLPSGAAVVGGGGAAIGAQRATGKENNAQEQIWAQCMEKRGYSAYTSK